MKRKVARIGPSTLMVSLPSQWVKQNNVKKGDELEIVEEDNHLTIIKGKAIKSIKTLSLDIKSDNRRLIRGYIYGAYKNGFDEISVRFTNPKVLDIISDEVNELIGFEIISHKSDSCLIKNVASPNQEAFFDLVNKSFLITISFAEDILKCMQEKNTALLRSIEMQEITQNKLILASQRILSLGKEKLVPMPHLTYYILSELESVGDDLKYICQYYQTKKNSLEKESETFFVEFMEKLRDTYHIYLKFDVEKLINMIHKRETTANKINLLLENCQKDQRVLISYLFSAYLKISDIRREILHSNIK